MLPIEIQSHEAPASVLEMMTAIGTTLAAILAGVAVIVALVTSKKGRDAAFQIAKDDRQTALRIAERDRKAAIRSAQKDHQAAQKLANDEHQRQQTEKYIEAEAQARLVLADHMGDRQPLPEGQQPEGERPDPECDVVSMTRIINHSGTPILNIYSEVWSTGEDLTKECPRASAHVEILLPESEQLFKHPFHIEGYYSGMGVVQAFRLRWTDNHGRAWCVDQLHGKPHRYEKQPPSRLELPDFAGSPSVSVGLGGQGVSAIRVRRKTVRVSTSRNAG